MKNNREVITYLSMMDAKQNVETGKDQWEKGRWTDKSIRKLKEGSGEEEKRRKENWKE